MPLSPRLLAQVRRRLTEFLSDPKPDPLRLREVVATFGALPLCSDMGGCTALRPDGEIVSFAWDAPHGLKIEDDLRMRNAALYQGSSKYPELAVLVPARPPTARDCPHCGGSGAPLLALPAGAENIVCFCGGLGWIPLEAKGV
jgi:hypothetical protein